MSRITEILAQTPASSAKKIALYWTVPSFEDDLNREINAMGLSQDVVLDEGERVWLAYEGTSAPALAWARSTWAGINMHSFSSIGEAQKFLKPQASRWISASLSAHRRCQLIQEKLPGYPRVWRDFREGFAGITFGGFLLISESTLLYSTEVTPQLPLEGPTFQEDKLKPSRAYLKLWEAFHRLQQMPGPNDRCFELGASPGGWTAVLRGLGAEVWAVDRADLAPALMNDSQVHFSRGDGFLWNPIKAPGMTWVLSDVICYPEKLWEWVQPWLKQKDPPTLLCTIKFQGETDFATLAKFKAVPGSQVFHLFQNKHELTWFWAPPAQLPASEAAQ